MKASKLKSLVSILTPALCTCIFTLSSCSSDADEPSDSPSEPVTPKTRVDIPMTAEQKAVMTGLTDFNHIFTRDALSYHDATAEPGDDGNMILSPLSASMLFAMVGNGIDEKGKKAYADYLGVSDFDALNKISRILLTELPEVDNTSKMALANSIWVNKMKNITLKKSYSSLAGEIFDAKSTTLDFNSKAIDVMNEWCSDQTNGLIKDFFKNIDPASYAVLINALYFKTTWTGDIFKEENTENQKFYGINSTSTVKMMKSVKTVGRYSCSDKFESFQLDFGNKAFGITIIVPKEKTSLSELNDILTPEKYAQEFGRSFSTYMIVRLPRFKVESDWDITKMFHYAGKDELNDSFEFEMYEPSVGNGFINYRQAATLSLDESGAEAAAVTAGEMYGAAPGTGPAPVIEITVDKPFLFFINEVSTGACLISGRVAQL